MDVKSPDTSQNLFSRNNYLILAFYFINQINIAIFLNIVDISPILSTVDPSLPGKIIMNVTKYDDDVIDSIVIGQQMSKCTKSNTHLLGLTMRKHKLALLSKYIVLTHSLLLYLDLWKTCNHSL